MNTDLNVTGSSMVDCIAASASAQHIEAPINKNNNLLDSCRGFFCQDEIFCAEVEISDRFHIPPLAVPRRPGQAKYMLFPALTNF